MIRILEDAVVDQIAAGEVVERPASVLKELIENSLDAGATELDVVLAEGGAALVKVVDDGSGMSADDALLCIERHATSKIRAASDLVGVRTLGFRGEAVPSIASVSRFRLTTRRAVDEVGTEVRVDGGRLGHVGPAAAAPGTTIEVRDLFHSVPARRKFLRTRQTELSHCIEQLVRQLVLRPQVSIRAVHEGREVLRSPSSDDLRRRVRDLLGPDADALVEVDHRAHGVRVRGLTSPVGVHRSTAQGSTYTFVQGRFVRDAVVRRGLTEAYRGVLPQGRFPLCVLDVSVADDEVDVNVHPAKTEVRFRRPREVIQAIAAALGEALHARELPSRRGTTVGGPSLPAPQSTLFEEPPPPVSAMPPASSWPSAPVVVEPPVAYEVPPRPEAVAPVAPQPAGAAVVPRPVAAPVPAPRRIWGVFGDVAVGVEDGAFLLVDVAALHRHAVEQSLVAAMADGGEVPSQPLLAPLRVDLERAVVARLVAGAEPLGAVGVDLSAFGPGELAVMGLPALVALADAAELLVALDDALRAETPLVDVIVAHAQRPEAERELVLGWMASWAPRTGDEAPPWRRCDEAELARWLRAR